MSGTEAVGFRAVSVPLTCCYKFTEVLVVVLNLQIRLVAYMRVCHMSSKLAVTVRKLERARLRVVTALSAC